MVVRPGESFGRVDEVTVTVLDAGGKQIATATGERDGASWNAEVELPANVRADGQAQTYSVRAKVVDEEGRRADAESKVRVLAPEPPPPLSQAGS